MKKLCQFGFFLCWVYGINFNFNGWGEKQEHTYDSKVADFITTKANAKIINSNLVLEGGSFEIDGAGTAILTESSVLNDNRNPNVTRGIWKGVKTSTRT